MFKKLENFPSARKAIILSIVLGILLFIIGIVGFFITGKFICGTSAWLFLVIPFPFSLLLIPGLECTSMSSVGLFPFLWGWLWSFLALILWGLVVGLVFDRVKRIQSIKKRIILLAGFMIAWLFLIGISFIFRIVSTGYS